MRRAERLIAWRYLKPTKGEGFISVIAAFALVGIALGVGTLIVVLAVMNGFRSELLGRVLGVNGHATIIAGPEGLVDDAALVTRIREIDGVVDAMAYVEGQVMASANDVAAGAVVRGVRAEDLARRDIFADNIVAGTLYRLDEGDGVLIGTRMAQRMGLGLGSQLSLISPKGAATAFGTVPRIKSFEVVGLFEVGMYEYDNSFVYIGLADAQAYFQLDGRVTAVEVLVDQPEQVQRWRQPIAAAAEGQGRVVDWQQLNSHFFNALEVERNVMFLILTAIVIVATFNIVSGLVVLVRNKGPDIAILRTMGATSGMVMRVFLLTGASIGVVGTTLGLVLGVSFSLNIEAIQELVSHITGTDVWNPEVRFLTEMPAKVQWSEVVSVTIMALGLSFAATLYPSWRASRLDPVEALRYE